VDWNNLGKQAEGEFGTFRQTGKAFDANKYVNESEFSGEIYNQVFKDLAEEHAGDGYN
jgi:hypothetical protein